MNGIDQYNNKYKQKINTLIKNSKNRLFLEGYYYYLVSNMVYSSAYIYIYYVETFLKEEKIFSVKNITLINYTRYLEKIKDNTASYRIAVYSALKKFSRYLAANKITDDYMMYVGRPKYTETQITKDKRETSYLTKPEVKKVIKNIHKPSQTYNHSDCWKKRDEVIILIFLNTGIRCSALYKLDVDDVDLINNTITVMEKREISRKITISQNVSNSIKEWLNYRKEILDGKEESALIISKRKRRLDNASIYRVVSNATDIVEDKNISPHKLRATYGTQLYNKTHDLYFVQKCMGHSNPKTTELYIRGQRDEATKKASELMDDMLF